MIVVGIFAMLSFFSYAAFANLNKSQSLDKDVAAALSLLETARMYTLASKGGMQYGVHFESGKAVLYAGAAYVANATSSQTLSLNRLDSIGSISLSGGGGEVLFDRLTGETSQDGSVVVSLKSSTTTKKTITIGKTGLAEIN